MKLTIDRNLHKQMSEITKRQRRTTGKTLGLIYTEALQQFIDKNAIPKRIERVLRHQFLIKTPPAMLVLYESCVLIARKERVPIHIIIERALRDYVSLPDNYLGRTFYHGIKKEFYE
jgi:hypothetical protein